MLYRIYTEDKGNLPKLVNQYFANFTIIKGGGCWEGRAEKAAIIEIITENQVNINALARFIKYVNIQQAVLVTKIALYGEYSI